MQQFIKSFTPLIQYFKDITDNSTYFKYFQSGGTEKIIGERLQSDLRSRVNYPLFFMEWPFIKLTEYGSSSTEINFRTGFVVLEDPAKDDWDAQDLAMANTLAAVQQILQQMRIDNAGLNKKFFKFDLNLVSIDPIDNLFIDNAMGWRCEFEVQNPVDLSQQPYCRNPSFWKS